MSYDEDLQELKRRCDEVRDPWDPSKVFMVQMKWILEQYEKAVKANAQP